MPSTSEVNRQNKTNDFTGRISFYKNHTFGNLLAALIIAEYPKEHSKLPSNMK